MLTDEQMCLAYLTNDQETLDKFPKEGYKELNVGDGFETIMVFYNEAGYNDYCSGFDVDETEFDSNIKEYPAICNVITSSHFDYELNMEMTTVLASVLLRPKDFI